MNNYIPLEECKHSFLYRIFSRNLRLGVFNANSRGFIGIREKFGYEYLFTEYHWDIGDHCSTVKPKELLEECPIDFNNEEEMFDWLKQKEKQYLDVIHASSIDDN